MINLNFNYNLSYNKNYSKEVSPAKIPPIKVSQLKNKVSFGHRALEKITNPFLPSRAIKFDLSNIIKSVSSKTLDVENILRKFKAAPFLNADEYKALPSEVKRIISEAAPEPSICAAKDSVPWAVGLRKYYNDTFGENQYSVVSIGHSPEPIARVMEHMGGSVKYLPLSDVSSCRRSTSFIKAIKSSNNYLRYMEKIGLFDFEKPKTIFLDYTDTGKTLRYLKKFFLDEIQVEPTDIEFRSLNNDMKKVQRLYNKRTDLGIPNAKNALSRNSLLGYVFYYLTNSKAERFQNIPSLPFYRVDNIFEKLAEDNSSPFGKFFNFKVLEILEKLKLLPKKIND